MGTLAEEIPIAGYQDLVERIEEQWIYLRFYRGNNVVLALGINDRRVERVVQPRSVTYHVTLRGRDTDIAAQMPWHTDAFAVHETDTDDRPVTIKEFDVQTIAEEGHVLEIRHTVEFETLAGLVGPQGPPGKDGPQGPPGPGLNVKGSLPKEADLQAKEKAGGLQPGDAYITEDDGQIHVWDGKKFVTMKIPQALLARLEALEQTVANLPTYVGDDSINIT